MFNSQSAPPALAEETVVRISSLSLKMWESDGMDVIRVIDPVTVSELDTVAVTAADGIGRVAAAMRAAIINGIFIIKY